ncbi:hypothetical protein PTKIN_Ptkin14bG0161100 [Pterospermum kingtungense]
MNEIMDEGIPNGQVLETPNLKVVTFAELKSATKNFKGYTLLGGGGLGHVYKGWVDEKTLKPSKIGFGMIVAIKKLNHAIVWGCEEWESEVKFIGSLAHPNLVKLLGYCWKDTEMFLVYEFMQKGSFENHLFRRSSAIEPLSWELRLKMAIGAARGLSFLHSFEKVIYRDFKASDILLDGNYNAKISDFGLVKESSHVNVAIKTCGYIAPESARTGRLSAKSDVYGFGVVLLEMMTGLQASDAKRPVGRKTLVDWLKPTLSQEKKKLKTVIDAGIEGQYSSKAAIQFAELALKCLEEAPKHRPSMREAVVALERIAEDRLGQ